MAKQAVEKKALSKKAALEEYSRVVEVSRLDIIQLIELNFFVRPIFFKDNADNELSYDIELAEWHYNSEDGIAMAFVSASVSAQQEDEENETLLCAAKYNVIYSLEDECEQDAVHAFLKKVSVFACYPYFRALFATMDAAANTHLPPLPIHKEVVSRRQAKKVSAEVEAIKH